MSKIGRYSASRIKVEEITASQTVTVGDCGTLFVINPTADTTLTLPDPDDAGSGWWIEVMVDEEDGGKIDFDVNIDMSAGATFLTGLLVGSDGTAINKALADFTDDDHVHFAGDSESSAARATSGVMVHIICTGSRYVANGIIVDNANVKFHNAAVTQLVNNYQNIKPYIQRMWGFCCYCTIYIQTKLYQ